MERDLLYKGLDIFLQAGSPAERREELDEFGDYLTVEDIPQIHSWATAGRKNQIHRDAAVVVLSTTVGIASDVVLNSSPLLTALVTTSAGTIVKRGRKKQEEYERRKLELLEYLAEYILSRED